MIDPQDEELHPPGSEAHWQESYYFNWADLDGTSFGLTRIGLHDGGRLGDGVLLTVRDGQPEALYPGVGLEVDTPASAADGIRVGDLAFTMDEALGRWHITLQGRTRVDLTWQAFMPAYDFADGGTVGDLAHHHFEQCGTVTGTIEVDGVERPVKGVGHRDKSWGPRDWSGTTGWEWLSAQFGPDLAFNVSIGFDGDTPIHNGFVFRDGSASPLAAATVDYTWDGAEHVPASARIVFTDLTGERFEVSATALGQAPLVKDELFIQETHAAFTLERAGVTRHGVGVLEHAWHAGVDVILERMDQLAPILALAEKANR